MMPPAWIKSYLIHDTFDVLLNNLLFKGLDLTSKYPVPILLGIVLMLILIAMVILD